MLVDIALPDIDARHVPPFAVARTTEPCRPLELAARTRAAVSRLVGGMPVVLVQRDEAGDLRSYGDATLAAVLPEIELSRQCWVSFVSIEDEHRVPAGLGSES